MTKIRKKLVFNIFGILVVCFWLAMMASHYQRTRNPGEVTGPAPEGKVLSSMDAPQREWREIFLGEKKVGFTMRILRPFGETYFIRDEMFLKMGLMGTVNVVHTVIHSKVDRRFILRDFDMIMNSGAVRFRLAGRVEGDFLILNRGVGKEKREERIKLDRPPMIGASMAYYLKSRPMGVGETFRLPFLDPASLAQNEMVINVVRKEAIVINGMKYDTLRLETSLWGQKAVFWVDSTGETLKEVGLMGLTTIKSSAARAPRNLDEGLDMDFYDRVAVKPGRTLPDPRHIRYLQVKLAGVQPNQWDLRALGSGRQEYKDGHLTIRKETVPKAPYVLPHRDDSHLLKRFLSAEYNIESDSDALIDQANAIAAGETNGAIVASRMMAWVYRKLDKRPVISIPSAAEVLRTLTGDCNEHAVLLVALLRAAGVPARMSIGLVYTREKFFYHAWTEAYLGEWVTMDATLNQMPVDATHIKLIEGNLDKQVALTGILGKLKLEVLEYRHD
jgi:hypothetical protein